MKKFNFSKGLVIGLLTLALCLTCFAAAKVSAEEENKPSKTTAATTVEYNADDDTIRSADNNGKSVVYVLKAASGNLIKSGTAANGTMANGKISIADLGIKSTSKDVYLYVCDKEVEVDAGETVNANLTIKAPAAKKLTGTIDYTQADYPNSTAVLSAVAIDSSRKEIDSSKVTILWAATADATTWYEADSSAKSGRKIDKEEVVDGFTGKDLSGMLSSGGTIFIKMKGVSGTTADGAQFGSKVVKVKISKQAAAPKVKIDVNKDTLGVKNGFDFGFASYDATAKAYSSTDITWFTVLPVLKTAKIKTADCSIVPIENFKPLDKKATGFDAVITCNDEGELVTADDEGKAIKVSYTQYKFKALSMDAVLELLDSGITQKDSGTIGLAVRKSATAKKPASAVTVVEVAVQTAAPIVYTSELVQGEYLITSTEDFAKKGLTIDTIENYPGTVGGKVATSGFNSTFKVGAAAGATVEGKDENAASYVYAVVNVADWYAGSGNKGIDWTTVKWSKLVPGKTKFTSKTKGSYALNDGTKQKVTLKETTVEIPGRTNVEEQVINTVVNEEATFSGGSFILVRRAGNAASLTRMSDYVKLFIVKDGKTYSLYNTESYGEVAYKYTIDFATFKAPTTTTRDGWYIDDGIPSVSVWTQKKYTGITLPALTDAEYWAIGTEGANSDESKYFTVSTTKQFTPESTATNKGDDTDAIAKGQYKIEMSANGNNASGDGRATYLIREYANITVLGTYGSITESTFSKYSDVDDAILAVIEKGKLGEYNSTSKKFVFDKDADPEYYVGDQIAIEPRDYTPDGYAIPDSPNSSWPKAVEAPTGASYAVNNLGNNGSIPVTAYSSENVEAAIQFEVVKLVSLKVKSGSARGAALTKKDGTAITAQTTFKKGTNVEFKVTGVTFDVDGQELEVKKGETALTATSSVYTITAIADDTEVLVTVKNKPFNFEQVAVEGATYSIVSGVTSDKATYGTDVVFTVEYSKTGYHLAEVQYKVGDGAFTALTVNNGKFNIPGNAIKGDIKIKAVEAAD